MSTQPAPAPALGAAIRYYRTHGPRAPMSQGALARQVGVSRPAVTQWESGNALPEWARLALIAAALGVGLYLLIRYGEAVASGAIKAGAPLPGPM